ncbi:MAG: pyruvate formate lyase family protein, partial [Planctomycetota bacterium]
MLHPAPDDSTRISTLRRRCIDRKGAAWRNVSVVTARSLRASESVGSWQVRKGLCTRDRLRAVRFALDDLELLAGRPSPRPGDVTQAELDDAADYLKKYAWPGGQSGHCQLDYSRVFARGLDGMRAELRERMKDAERAAGEVYQSMIHALDGLTDLAENAARIAEGAATDSPEWRRLELSGMAESCRRTAHEPPATFRDGLQLVWFMTFGVMHGDRASLVGPGRLDRRLARLYEADRAAGRLTRDEALLLIESLYLLINEYVPDGLAMPVMVGGRDADGRDVTNDLSYLCLEALRRTGLIYPTVGVCWHEGTPPDLVDLAIDLIAGGCSTPAFFGDETIRKGLEGLGLPGEQACDYINSTCVEITPCGASNVWVASPYFSTCGDLLEEIDDEVASGREAESFKQFRDRYHARLSRRIADAVRRLNELRRERRRHGGKPLQSAFTRDCIARGRDIDDGGAVYNWVECSFVGLANLADSLHVVREEVYRRGTLTLGDLKAVLDADFECYEP